MLLSGNEEFENLIRELEIEVAAKKEYDNYDQYDQRDYQLRLELHIIDKKIKVYEHLINDNTELEENVIEIFKRKLEYLHELKNARCIYRRNISDKPILLSNLNDIKLL